MKKLYLGLGEEWRAYQHKTLSVKDKDGEMVADENRWVNTSINCYTFMTSQQNFGNRPIQMRKKHLA